MKKSIKRIIATFLTIVSLFSIFTICASASTCSSGKSSRTITVTTKANWLIPGSESITLSQTKGTRSLTTYSILKRKNVTSTKDCYGTWDIVAKATDGSHEVKTKLNGSSVKINLKPNKTYKITVTWNNSIDIIDGTKYGNFSKHPTWKVKSTYKVSNYY